MNSELPPSPPKSGNTVTSGVWVGLFFVLIFQVISPFLFLLADDLIQFEPKGSDDGFFLISAWLSVGWTAPFYLVPYAIFQRCKGRPLHANGVFILTGILFLVTSFCNAGVWGNI